MWQCGMYDTVQISVQKKKKEGKKEKYLNRKKKNTPFSHFHFSNTLKFPWGKLTTNSPATSEQNFVQKAN